MMMLLIICMNACSNGLSFSQSIKEIHFMPLENLMLESLSLQLQGEFMNKMRLEMLILFKSTLVDLELEMDGCPLTIMEDMLTSYTKLVFLMPSREMSVWPMRQRHRDLLMLVNFMKHG